MLRHSPQLFLHPLQVFRYLPSRTQPHRIARREPPHCPPQTHRSCSRRARYVFLSPVSFQCHDPSPCSRPPPQRSPQTTQQGFVDLCVIELPHFLQQPLRLLLVQLHTHLSHISRAVLHLIVVNRDDSFGTLQHLLPVSYLPAHLRALCISLQLLRPLLERTALGTQLHLLAALCQLLVASLQVFQQDAPRDTIDGEMMHDDK